MLLKSIANNVHPVTGSIFINPERYRDTWNIQMSANDHEAAEHDVLLLITGSIWAQDPIHAKQTHPRPIRNHHHL